MLCIWITLAVKENKTGKVKECFAKAGFVESMLQMIWER
jgi:hypothetical protein